MMRLPKFDYRSPRAFAEAVKIIGDPGPYAESVAGGTDLYPSMKRRQQMPRTVISVMRLSELNKIDGDGKGGLRIGASVLLSDIVEHPIIKRDYPVVASAARTISTPLLRNMGTIGGNLLLDTRCNYYNQNYEWRRGVNFCLKKDGDVCWVAPGSSKCWAVQSSDLVPAMVAVGAKFRLASTLGERMIDAAGFYNDGGIDYLPKRPDKLFGDIYFSAAHGLHAPFQKPCPRGALGFPVLVVAAYVRYDMDSNGALPPGRASDTITDAKIVVAGIPPCRLQVNAAA